MALARPAGGCVAETVLDPRAASLSLVGAIRSLLVQNSLAFYDLAGVGVVNGPGSFTGVRIGLALAKGLCEATDVPLAVVSRLEVLADVGPPGAICLSSAGRDAMYVGTVQGGVLRERTLRDDQVQELRRGASVVVDSAQLVTRLAGSGPVKQVDLSAIDAFRPVLRQFAEGGSDVASTDANYLRDEATIYRRVDPEATSMG